MSHPGCHECKRTHDRVLTLLCSADLRLLNNSVLFRFDGWSAVVAVENVETRYEQVFPYMASTCVSLCAHTVSQVRACKHMHANIKTIDRITASVLTLQPAGRLKWLYAL